MIKRTTLATLGLASLGVLAGAACGGVPKPDLPSAPPAVATDTALAVVDAAPPASSAAATPAEHAAGGKLTADECDALVTDANVTLDAERIKVDKICKSDADCVGIRGRACTFTCQNGAIPKAELAEWDGTVATIKQNQCKKWSDNDCSKTSPPKKPPTCGDDTKKPSCKKGKCILQ